ncbi:MAG: RluA family pseudouridine synthase [Planctomycetota bacterium]|nr:RluA family pseudouridine synthase [Planctomycetota bacterium]
MLPSKWEPEIFAAERDYIIVRKPPGVETTSENGSLELLSPLRRLLGDPGLRPVHRLDRDTSGAQLFARNPEAEKTFLRLFRERLVEKRYLAFCLGAPRNRRGTINRNLSEWSGGQRPVRTLRRGGLTASTGYECLALSGWLPGGWRAGFLSFAPRQGRTHQIRVHASALGYPVLGDDRYGERAFNKLAKEHLGLTRQALHAWRLAFEWKGKKMEAICPLPEDMRQAGEKAGLSMEGW